MRVTIAVREPPLKPVASAALIGAAISLLGASLAGAAPGSDTVYKSIDPDGKVRYQDVDIETPAGMAAFARTGGGGIPVLQAKGHTVRGFSTAAYDALFAGAS
jgi:hypothetical protein